MKDRLFVIGSFLVIIAAVIAAVVGFSGMADDFEMVFGIAGIVLLIFGVIFLITGFTNPLIAQSKTGTLISYILIIGSLTVIAGMLVTLAVNATGGPVGLSAFIPLGGAILILLCFLMWPCLCCKDKDAGSRKVFGIAASHGKISISDLAKYSGYSEDTVRDIIYDGIGSGKVAGKMEGDMYIHAYKTTTVTTSSPTREREIVKVLVVCPYCGAKNEQGTPKCHQCQAPL
ncbi:MAG: hypothetical protein GF411_04080 [Candidatus Lokiarchaeota archaeon]|nr:hypothetical protein [Candidatus Lokiarchaeota archaeon]